MFYLKGNDEVTLEKLIPINSCEDLQVGDYVICTDIVTDSREVLGLIGYVEELFNVHTSLRIAYASNDSQKFNKHWFTNIKALKKLDKNVCDYEHEEDIFEDIDVKSLREEILEKLSKE